MLTRHNWTFNMKSKIRKTIWVVIGILVLLALSFFLLKKTILGNVIKDGSSEANWAKENCNCTERNNLKCPDGYEVRDRLCAGEGSVTNPVLGCSKYDCNGTIYEVKL